MALDLLAVDNFDFTRNIVKNILGEKPRENVGFLSKLKFWAKI